ncbi:MAG: translation initiation factor IF-3 [Oscillospiraceae bacterium]|jgi:translation initiation factor IF-3|nr:translation initiation factor IF-3 [Oscillospiraceae bacterium]
MLINDAINAAEVRVVGKDGEPLGIMRTSEAQALADRQKSDLVLIAPQGTPPVAKIMDYGKFRFEQSKKDKEMRKNQKQAELKEIRMGLHIDSADITVKATNANKFLKAGDKVKLMVRFRGREMTHQGLGTELLKKFAEICSEFGSVESASKMDGRNMFMILAPKTAVLPNGKPKQEQVKGGRVVAQSVSPSLKPSPEKKDDPTT